VFVDVISVSAVLYIINFANCYQNGPIKTRKEAKEGREGKESNHNRLFQAVFLSWGGGITPQAESNTTPPSSKA
jgi:hypothetical protein